MNSIIHLFYVNDMAAGKPRPIPTNTPRAAKRHYFGVKGVTRYTKDKWMAYVYIGQDKHILLKTPDMFEAICARKSYDKVSLST